MILDSSTSLRVVLAAAVTTTELDFAVHYASIDVGTQAITQLSPVLGTTNGTTAATMLTASSADTKKQVKSFSVYNADTASATVIIQLYKGSTATVIHKKELAAGESLNYNGVSFGGTDEKKNNIASTANNTTTPLDPGREFVGEWERVDYPDVMASCKTDVAGLLKFEFSNDADNADVFPSAGFELGAGIHEFHTAVKGYRYFRVRVINGSDMQSYLRCYTYFGTFRQPSAPLNQPLGLDADAILTRPTFPWLDVARGLVSGMEVVQKFGDNQSIGTGYTPVCSAGVYQTPTSAVSLEFISSDAADALDDTGMHELTIEGLDANWERQTVSTAAHATDGTTAVSISGTWLRVFRAYVSKSGTYATASAASHAGTITIRVSGGGATWANIPLIDSFPVGQSLIGAYTIPSGYTGYVFLTTIGVDAGKTVNAAFFSRSSADDTASSYDGTMRVRSIVTGLTGGSVLNRTGANVPYGPFTGPTDIGWLALVSTGTAEVSVEFEIFLVKNAVDYVAVTPPYAISEAAVSEVGVSE